MNPLIVTPVFLPPPGGSVVYAFLSVLTILRPFMSTVAIRMKPSIHFPCCSFTLSVQNIVYREGGVEMSLLYYLVFLQASVGNMVQFSP